MIAPRLKIPRIVMPDEKAPNYFLRGGIRLL